MKQVAILSGKGGTGKTTIAGSFAALSKNAVFADCDVDASNLHLLLKPKITEKVEFKGLNLASIDNEKCIGCGRCYELCRFNSVFQVNDDKYEIDPMKCEGCKVCVISCPVQAIRFEERVCGYAYISETAFGPMSHADLLPGMENSGKLVTLVRQNAAKLAEETNRNLVLVDGSPGIGCPVIASIANLDASVVVVEPTFSGIHDLERVIDLLDHFSVIPYVIINKYDINKENSKIIEKNCESTKIPVLAKIPFDHLVTESMVNGEPIVVYDQNSPASIEIKKSWNRLKKLLEDT